MLKIRLLTAMVMIPLLIAAVFFLDNFYFNCAWAAVILLAGWEWTGLMRLSSTLHQFAFLLLLACLILLSPYVITWLVLLIAVFFWSGACYWLMQFPQGKKCWQGHVNIQAIVGFIILWPCWLAITQLHQHVRGPDLVMLVIICVAATDSGAYFIGRAIGKHKLLEAVSPNKTIEGFLGGVVIGLLATVAYAYWRDLSLVLSATGLLMMSFVILLSVVGDLTISMVKRFADCKDTGQLLPGHGGILDRIDSMTAAAPTAALLLFLLQLISP